MLKLKSNKVILQPSNNIMIMVFVSCDLLCRGSNSFKHEKNETKQKIARSRNSFYASYDIAAKVANI